MSNERRSTARDKPDRRNREMRERVLPHSIDAERAVLGAILINPQIFAVLPDGFSEATFYREAHRAIFSACWNLHQRQVDIDLLTVQEELIRTNRLDIVGGMPYLVQLCDGVPRSTNAPHYAGIVSEHAVRRGVIALSNQLLTDAYAAEAPSDDLVSQAQRGIIAMLTHGASKPESIGYLMEAARVALMDAYERKEQIVGVGTGFGELDAMTCGLQCGELSLLAARPSIGKTAMAVNIAEYVAMSGLVLLFSLEMTKAAIVQRMISARARVEGHQMRQGRLRQTEYDRVGTAMCSIETLNLVIDDTSGLPVEDLAQRSRRVIVEHGPVTLVIVDYLQLLGTRSRHDNRQQQISFISASLKALGKEVRAPVLALSQLSRAVEGRKDKRPMLSDLRESGALEQDADLVMFLHRPDEDDVEMADLIVAKQRQGPTGTIHLKFNRAYTRFDNLTEETQGDV